MINYPDKKFPIHFKEKFLKREDITINVTGLRFFIVRKQITRWGTSIIDAEEDNKDNDIGRILLSMVFCMKLMAMHFLALSHGYIMHHQLKEKSIEIHYEYCLID